MMGGDGSRFSKNDERFLLFNRIFVFDLLFLLVGPHPPNG
jgi:hypothetical protein